MSCPEARASSPSTDGRTRSTIACSVGRLALTRHAQLLDRGEDGPHCEWAHHHDQARSVARGGELDAADLGRRHDVAGDRESRTNPQTLIEPTISAGNARIGAPQDDRERLLPAVSSTRRV